MSSSTTCFVRLKSTDGHSIIINADHIIAIGPGGTKEGNRVIPTVGVSGVSMLTGQTFLVEGSPDEIYGAILRVTKPSSVEL